MESTKSQLVLRSMDMDGRSLGTERSSTFPDGQSNNQPGARVSDALAGGDRFAAVLASRTEHGGDASTQGDVSARVREGRTDAATATYNSREAREKAWKPRDDRTVERTDDSESWEVSGDAAGEARRGTEDAALDDTPDAGTTSGEGSRKASAGEPAGSSHSEGSTVLDANEAQGQAGSNAVQPAAAGPMGANVHLGHPNSGASAAATRNAALQGAQRGALQGALQGANGTAASRGQLAQPAQAVQRTMATSAAKAATKATAPRPSVPPEQARAILNDVRVQILDGKREARIQLRPIELGRLDLLIRVDGAHVVAKVAAESAEALAVLESHAPELRAWLAKDGAQTVDLEFSLIESGDQEFAHQSDEDLGASFESAAERRSYASPGSPRRRSTGETTLGTETTSRDAHTGSLGRMPQGGVDFVA